MLVTASFLVPGTNLCTKFETNHGKMELDSLFRCNSLVMGELTDDVIRTCSDTKYSIYNFLQGKGQMGQLRSVLDHSLPLSMTRKFLDLF